MEANNNSVKINKRIKSGRNSNIIKKILNYITVNHIWVFTIFFVPISLVYDCIATLRTHLVYFYTDTSTSHEERVKNVQRQVRDYIKSGSDKGMCTSRPAWKSVSLQPQVVKKHAFMQFSKRNYFTIMWKMCYMLFYSCYAISEL